MLYYYDESGSPVMFRTVSGGSSADYYYVKDLQGDIVAITNAAGSKVVEYTYDAWGKVLSTTGTLASTIGASNPYRYRGYWFDTETGLYYLQSRYYDPQTGRFINADMLVSTGQGVLGSNMFAYCLNNPVNNIDTTGKWTFGISVCFNICVMFGLSFSIGIFFDGQGGVEIQSSYVDWSDETKNVGFASASAGVSFQYTDRETVEDLHGYAYYCGAGFGAISADVITFDNPIQGAGIINGFQITVGIDVGIDTHVMVTKTEPLYKLRRPSTKKDSSMFVPKRRRMVVINAFY